MWWSTSEQAASSDQRPLKNSVMRSPRKTNHSVGFFQLHSLQFTPLTTVIVPLADLQELVISFDGLPRTGSCVYSPESLLKLLNRRITVNALQMTQFFYINCSPIVRRSMSKCTLHYAVEECLLEAQKTSKSSRTCTKQYMDWKSESQNPCSYNGEKCTLRRLIHSLACTINRTSRIEEPVCLTWAQRIWQLRYQFFSCWQKLPGAC